MQFMYLLNSLEFTTVNGKLTVWFRKSLLLSWKLFLFESCFLFFQLSFSFLTGHCRHLVCHLMFQDWMGPIHKWKWKGCDFSSWKHIHFNLSKKTLLAQKQKKLHNHCFSCALFWFETRFLQSIFEVEDDALTQKNLAWENFLRSDMFYCNTLTSIKLTEH